MRPRAALSLLALALPLPVLLAAAPRTTTAPPEAVVERVPVLREEATPSPLPRARTPRPAPRRTASRSRRVMAPRPAAPTPVATHSRTVSRSSSYPWATTSGGRDSWGFDVRQCVSYVAWRLSRVGRPVSTRQGWGSASGWDDVARRKGITVTSRPAVGSVAQWNAGERSRVRTGSGTGTFVAGSFGHVAWVTAVYADGSVQVSQYNGNGSRTYSSMRVFAPRFLRM